MSNETKHLPENQLPFVNEQDHWDKSSSFLKSLMLNILVVIRSPAARAGGGLPAGGQSAPTSRSRWTGSACALSPVLLALPWIQRPLQVEVDQGRSCLGLGGSMKWSGSRDCQVKRRTQKDRRLESLCWTFKMFVIKSINVSWFWT